MSTLFGIAGISAGVASINFGLAVLRRGDVLGGAVIIGTAVTSIGVGVAVLRRGEVQSVASTGIPPAGIRLGAACIGFGTAMLSGGEVLGGVALIGAGVALVGISLALVRDNDTLLGAADIGLAEDHLKSPRPDH